MRELSVVGLMPSSVAAPFCAGDFPIARFEGGDDILPLQIFKLFSGAHALGGGFAAGQRDGEIADAFRQGAIEIELAVA